MTVTEQIKCQRYLSGDTIVFGQYRVDTDLWDNVLFVTVLE